MVASFHLCEISLLSHFSEGAPAQKAHCMPYINFFDPFLSFMLLVSREVEGVAISGPRSGSIPSPFASSCRSASCSWRSVAVERITMTANGTKSEAKVADCLTGRCQRGYSQPRRALRSFGAFQPHHQQHAQARSTGRPAYILLPQDILLEPTSANLLLGFQKNKPQWLVQEVEHQAI